MKRCNLVKVFSITLCLTFMISTVAMAKENRQYKWAKASTYAVAPHPTSDNFPD